MAARLPIFLFYFFFTCCCDKGADLDESDFFRDRVLSLDFIDFQLGRLNNFVNHPVGRNEWEYNRRLSFVRRQSIAARQPADVNPSQSVLQRLQGRLGATIYSKVGNKNGECTFCYAEMTHSQKVVQLACWPEHQFHEDCYLGFVAHFETTGGALLCPICRTPINRDAVIKKMLLVEDNIQDMFNIPDANANQIDAVNENDFFRDDAAQDKMFSANGNKLVDLQQPNQVSPSDLNQQVAAPTVILPDFVHQNPINHAATDSIYNNGIVPPSGGDHDHPAADSIVGSGGDLGGDLGGNLGGDGGGDGGGDDGGGD